MSRGCRAEDSIAIDIDEIPSVLVADRGAPRSRHRLYGLPPDLADWFFILWNRRVIKNGSLINAVSKCVFKRCQPLGATFGALCRFHEVVFFRVRNGVAEMKALNSWVAAAITCSAIASQASADVVMFSETSADEQAVATGLLPIEGTANIAVKNPQESIPVRPVFVPGSLINKSNQGAWLMSQTGRPGNDARLPKASLIQLAGRGHGITPSPPAGTESRPISTFSQFVQLVKSSTNGDVVASVSADDDDVAPKTSNMTLIGLFTFSLAGITAVISASRRGYFGRTPRQRRARIF